MTTTEKAPKLRAWDDDIGVSVAGTSDPAKAAEFLNRWHAWDECCMLSKGDQCDFADQATYAGIDPTKRHRVRWYRMVPGCPAWCGEGHRSHIHDAKPHARGAFPVVEWFHGTR
ncbi:hypothetical protein ABN028_19725 [Actinopolymorpha sp. B17G11]|uniref:hypothetical protein n=1 Tax=Actinopolymorpha sp. B17G11 TaxID=3160861 RepID=UPI0032E41C62